MSDSTTGALTRNPKKELDKADKAIKKIHNQTLRAVQKAWDYAEKIIDGSLTTGEKDSDISALRWNAISRILSFTPPLQPGGLSGLHLHLNVPRPAVDEQGRVIDLPRKDITGEGKG